MHSRRASILIVCAAFTGSAFLSPPLVKAAAFGPNAPPAGPYAPAAGQAGSTAIASTNPLFTEWASGAVNLTRGPQDIANPTGPAASFGTAANALGPAGTDSSAVVSLGDGGSMTLSFDKPITNGTGADFAVFENGITDNFLELGFVEVSSDGSNFVRFPAVSLTQTTSQEGSFANDLQATNLYDLAGKYRLGFGTPFDLSELSGSANLDLTNVRFVRVVDVVGRITPVLDGNGATTWSPSVDYFGNLVNDPYATNFASGGFDLDGVGVINAVAPEPSTAVLLLAGSIVFFRRPRRAPGHDLASSL